MKSKKRIFVLNVLMVCVISIQTVFGTTSGSKIVDIGPDGVKWNTQPNPDDVIISKNKSEEKNIPSFGYIGNIVGDVVNIDIDGDQIDDVTINSKDIINITITPTIQVLIAPEQFYVPTHGSMVIPTISPTGVVINNNPSTVVDVEIVEFENTDANSPIRTTTDTIPTGPNDIYIKMKPAAGIPDNGVVHEVVAADVTTNGIPLGQLGGNQLVGTYIIDGAVDSSFLNTHGEDSIPTLPEIDAAPKVKFSIAYKFTNVTP